MFAFSRPQSALRDAITTAYRRDEAEAVADMLAQAQLSEDERREAEALARRRRCARTGVRRAVWMR